jgi:hypothetical protein
MNDEDMTPIPNNRATEALRERAAPQPQTQESAAKPPETRACSGRMPLFRH